MFLGNGRDDEGRMKVDEGLSQRRELRVTSADLEILESISTSTDAASMIVLTYSSAYCVHNEAAAAFVVLPSVCDEDRHLRVFVKKLLYPTIIYTLAEVAMASLLGSIVWSLVFVAEVLLL